MSRINLRKVSSVYGDPSQHRNSAPATVLSTTGLHVHRQSLLLPPPQPTPQLSTATAHISTAQLRYPQAGLWTQCVVIGSLTRHAVVVAIQVRGVTRLASVQRRLARSTHRGAVGVVHLDRCGRRLRRPRALWPRQRDRCGRPSGCSRCRDRHGSRRQRWLRDRRCRPRNGLLHRDRRPGDGHSRAGHRCRRPRYGHPRARRRRDSSRAARTTDRGQDDDDRERPGHPSRNQLHRRLGAVPATGSARPLPAGVQPERPTSWRRRPGRVRLPA